MARGRENNRLLGDPESGSNYGTSSPAATGDAFRSREDDEDWERFSPLKERGWSFQEGRRMIMTSNTLAAGNHTQSPAQKSSTNHPSREEKQGHGASFYLYCIIYALVNVIISAPGLYGYAAVIFNHPVFSSYMNALSKLVIFSSLIHQLGFFLFSSLDFAIGTVQDAGLIFLSGMANSIANTMLDDGHSEAEIVSTTLVLLSIGTAALGLILVIMGHFRLADAVSYLPMPVVGGYLAFIGFFCIQAGIALCISKSITSLSDWKYVFEPNKMILAVPGLGAGLVLTLVSRKATNTGALPLVMVFIPALFYFLVWVSGSTLDDMRNDGWVGPVAPSVPVGDLFQLVNFGQVRWDLIGKILPTWVGMVFVVSFASCLDVAAISIDMGEALDTNRELATVGLCNCEYTILNIVSRIPVVSLFNLLFSLSPKCSYEWTDIRIHWILYILSNHLHLSYWCPLEIDRSIDHGCIFVYSGQSHQCIGDQSPLFLRKYPYFHWIRLDVGMVMGSSKSSVPFRVWNCLVDILCHSCVGN